MSSSLWRKPPWWVSAMLAFVIVGVAALAFVWIEYSRTVEAAGVSPADGTLLKTSSLTVSFSLTGYQPGRGTPRVDVDGQPVSGTVLRELPGAVEATLTLPDGNHVATLDYSSANMFSRHLAASVKFSIDTVAPAVTITSPSSPDALGEARVRFAATLNEPARVQLTLDGKLVSLGGEQATDGAAATSGLTQSVSADVEVTDGAHQFALVATDQAGNSSTTRLAAWADLDAPVVAAASWPDGDWKRPSASVAFRVTDDFPDRVNVSATIDGSAVTPEPAAGTSATGTSAAGTTAAAAGTTSPAGTTTAAATTYNLSTGDLAEGLHSLSFSAVDAAGHSSTWTRSFVVNSTEAFGARPIGPGAKGKDVTELQQILAGRGFYKGKASGTFDDATAAAVAAYEAGRASAGGTVRAQTVVDLDMQKQLLGSIRIVLSERKLYFSRDGSLFKTYSVAVGQPAYPTPTGSFKIISKVVDPTWTPPDSPWAAGAVPIGPGPDDPLGTRWMGLNAPSVGIHGTYASSSIGTAASHGCVRMLLHQAEELFDLVFVGTPVEIVP